MVEINATVNEVSIRNWNVNTGEYKARKCKVKTPEKFAKCDVIMVTFDSEEDGKFESVVKNGECDLPCFSVPGNVLVGVYAYTKTDGKLGVRYSPTPVTMPIKVGSYINGQEPPTPTPGTYADLLEKIEDIENTGGGGSGVNLEVLTEIDPTEEHTNEQVYGAKALDETFVAIEEIINEVGKPITTEKIVNDAVTLDKVEEDFFDKGLLFSEKQGDISFLSYKKEGEKPITLVAYLKDKAEEITQDNGDGIPTVQAVCDYVEEQLKNVGGSSSKVFERIATYTVTPDSDGSLPTKITINKDDDGNPFELTDVYCDVLIGLTDGLTGRFYVSVGNPSERNMISVIGNATLNINNTQLRKWCFRVDNYGDGRGGLTSAPSISLMHTADFPSANVSTMYGQPIPVWRTIDIREVQFVGQAGNTQTFMEGTTITLWGVRK